MQVRICDWTVGVFLCAARKVPEDNLLDAEPGKLCASTVQGARGIKRQSCLLRSVFNFAEEEEDHLHYGKHYENRNETQNKYI